MTDFRDENDPRRPRGGSLGPAEDDSFDDYNRGEGEAARIRSSRPGEIPAENAERSISPVGVKAGNRRTQIVLTSLAGGGLALAALVGILSPHKKATVAPPVRAASETVAFEPVKAPPSLASAAPGTAPVLGADGLPIAPGTPLPGTPGTAGAVGASTGLTPTAAAPGTVPGLDPNASGSGGGGSQQMTPAQKRAALYQASIRAPLMAFSANQGGSTGGADGQPGGPGLVRASSDAQGGQGPGGTELDSLRKGSQIGKARARMIGDRNYLIVAGTSIPCVLQTAMDSSQPGYVTCLIPRDIYSDNGRIVLLEKGTKVLGEYRSNLRQGQKRLFVLWDRAVTPGGVAIDVSSPASDSLGRAGFDGRIETFFWERFGAALLFSVIDDAGSIASNRLAQSSGNGAPLTITNAPSNTASTALQNEINIPPVIRKNQGGEVSISVAQDFDFSSVYNVKPR